MIPSNPKAYYTQFLKGHEGKLHFSAHSHHFWPDVSRVGHMAYWDDSASLSDDKWNKIFSETIPKTQKHIAKILNLKNHEQIVLAPNTHELSTRLLSLFLGQKGLKILTTSNEFHSWRRQFLRLSEIPEIQVHQVDSNQFPYDKSAFFSKMKSELAKNYDVVFLSQVFFDSGSALTDSEVESLVNATPSSTLFVLDGYHGFAAIPCDLAKLEGRIFYLGGGYKYAQGGEGVGFMVIPKGDWRPAHTGWYADHAHLAKAPGTKVGYSDNGMAFMGATQDPSGFYRFNAVWDFFQTENLNVIDIHQYVLRLQNLFLQGLPEDFLRNWSLKPLFNKDLAWHGHFLTFEAPTIELAESCHQTLATNHVLIDRRGTRLRFGFGLYQNETDVLELISCLKKLALKSL